MSILHSKKIWIIAAVIVVLYVGSMIVRAASGFIGRTVFENMVEHKLGNKTDVDMKNDGTMDIKTKEGTFTTGNVIPKDWPKDVPAYADAVVTYSASTNPNNGKTTLALVLSTNDKASEVKTFYETELAANDWKITNTMQGGGTAIITAEKDDRTVSLAITESEDATGITIGVEAEAK